MVIYLEAGQWVTQGLGKVSDHQAGLRSTNVVAVN